MISDSAIIYPNVEFGEGCIVEPFAIVGQPPRGHEPGDVPTRIGRGACIRSHTVIYAGNVIGDRFQCGNKANIRESNEIGDDVSVGTLSVVEHHVKIAPRVRIHTQVFIPEYTTLDDESWVGPNVVFTNAKYPRSPSVKDELLGAHVERRAMIGANSTLLPGIRIGEHALVGAGSVVTEDVPPYQVWVGNPARFLKQIERIPYETAGTS